MTMEPEITIGSLARVVYHDEIFPPDLYNEEGLATLDYIKFETVDFFSGEEDPEGGPFNLSICTREYGYRTFAIVDKRINKNTEDYRLFYKVLDKDKLYWVDSFYVRPI